MRRVGDDLGDLLNQVKQIELVAARMTRMMGEMTQLLDLLQFVREALWRRLRCDAEPRNPF